MPLIEYGCMSGHVTETLVRRGADRPALTRCGTCGGPAAHSLSSFGITHGALSTEIPLKHLHEAALEAEHAGLPSSIAHAARVRAEAQMQAGAKRWTPERAWNAAEIR